MPGVKGASGRKKSPTRHLEIIGRKDRLKGRANEPIVIPCESMTMPKDYNEIERDIWQIYYQMLCNNQTLSATDFSMLDQFVRCYSEFLTLEKFLKEHGLTFSNDKGDPILRPEARQRNDTRRELRSLSCQFGFSPSSRSGVQIISKGKTENRWAIRK